MTTYKITIADQNGNQHRVTGQDTFTNISEAMQKALSEKERMMNDYGELEEKAKENECDINWCYENCKIQLELQRWEDDEISELTSSDFENIDTDLMKKFEADFQTSGWGFCLTDFFHYSK